MSDRILVTGGNGFLGHYVKEALLAHDLMPIIFDRVATFMTQWLGDVRDASAVSEAVSQTDGVIHLAGILGTQETIQNPIPSVETNIFGSLNVFEACAFHKKPCVYIAVGNHWMENSYSITKTTAERFAIMYRRERGAKIAIVRALNAYGIGQKLRPVRKILPTFIDAALRGEPIEIYGDGSQVMDMIHVGDVAEILVRALLRADEPVDRIYEAGTGRRTTVTDIAELVLATTGSRAGIRYLPMRPGEPPASVVLGDPETLRPLYGGQLPFLRHLQDELPLLVGAARLERAKGEA